jgi:anti-sigma regulatory factor (Ser/Thr protein kinase)
MVAAKPVQRRMPSGDDSSADRSTPTSAGGDAYWPGVPGKPSVMGQVPDPPRSTSKELRAGPRTPEEARVFLSEALERFNVDVDTGAARLLTSEIASNAVRHGKEPIDMSVSVEEDGLRVSVFDRGSGFDPGDLRSDEDVSPEAWAEEGRGLKLVHALSSDWGVERRDEGTEVWFRL